MIAKKALTALGVVVFGAGLMVSPVQAKCTRDCKRSFHDAFVACKGLCAPKKAGRDCRRTCKTTFVQAKRNCNKNATPPACSASGAFIDSSID